MRTIINHSGRFILRREDFLAITGNDDCCSQLLSILEYWTACRLEEIDRVEAYNASAARGDGRLIKKMDLWLYERAEDFKQGILAGYGNETIKKSLRKLESLGFICTKPSPHAWDRTKMYRLNIEAVQQAIADWVKSLKPLWERENENALGGNEDALGGNESGVSSYLNIQSINQKNNQHPPLPPQGEVSVAPPQSAIVEEEEEQLIDFACCQEDQAITLPNQPNQSLGLTVPPPRENDSQIPKIRKVWEDTGKIPSYGLEYRLWLDSVLGDRVKSYRSSGMALTPSPNDISPEFKQYVAKKGNLGKGMPLHVASKWIVNCEKNPERWEELADLIDGWQGKAEVTEAETDLPIPIDIPIPSHWECPQPKLRRKFLEWLDKTNDFMNGSSHAANWCNKNPESAGLAWDDFLRHRSKEESAINFEKWTQTQHDAAYSWYEIAITRGKDAWDKYLEDYGNWLNWAFNRKPERFPEYAAMVA